MITAVLTLIPLIHFIVDLACVVIVSPFLRFVSSVLLWLHWHGRFVNQGTFPAANRIHAPCSENTGIYRRGILLPVSATLLG